MCDVRKILILFVACLSLVSFTGGEDIFLSCGKRKLKTSYLIHKGSNALAGHWPWHVAIYHGNDYQCGGSILDVNTILTASHCVGAIPPKEVTVHVGRVNLNNTSEHTKLHEVQKIIVHPEYSKYSINHDIALIKLTSNITMNNYVQPVCLWTMESEQDLIVEKNGTIVGFGLNEQDIVTSQLKQALIQVLKPLTCIESDRYVFRTHLTSNVFCGLGRSGVSACNGDSGSGMFFEIRGKWFVRGLVSYTPLRGTVSLCDPLKPTVYTDVAKYLDWIKQHIDQRVLPYESNVFDIDYEEKLRLFNYSTCGAQSTTFTEFTFTDEVWTLPWFGVIYKRKSSRSQCAATLISEWYAVGLASCFETAVDDYTIVLRAEKRHKLQNVIKHPEYDAYENVHNIALIELMAPADTTDDNVKPICMPVPSEFRTNATTNLHVLVSRQSPPLVHIPVRYVESVQCLARLSQGKGMLTLDKNQLCAERIENVGEEVCTVPGSPLMELKLMNGAERYFLRGLDSFGVTCSPDLLNIYTNTELYLDWILYNMKYHTVETTNSTANQTLEEEWNMLEQQPGKEKLRLFNMKICGISSALQRRDDVPWIGIVYANLPGHSTDELAVLISEWYALGPKRLIHIVNVARYLLLGRNRNDFNVRFVEIKEIIIPPPDHPSQTFVLIELLEPADFNDPYIRPICLPFMKSMHQLNSTELVMSYRGTFYVLNLNLTMLSQQFCQQKILLIGFNLDQNISCAKQQDGRNFGLSSSSIQTSVQFKDHLRYFLYGMNIIDRTKYNQQYGVHLFNKVELTDLEWIMDTMQEKERQTSYLTSTINERVNVMPVQVPSSKKNLLNFATCGVSSRTYPTPWIGHIKCIDKQTGEFDARYSVTIISEWYVVGLVPPHESCSVYNEYKSVIFEIFCTTKISESCSHFGNIAVQKIVVHPLYDEANLVNNIALYQLATPLNTSVPFVKPICLPFIEAIRSFDTSSLRIISNPSYGIYNIINVDDRYVNQEECQKRWKVRMPNIIIDKSNHCVMNKRKSDEECVSISPNAILYSRQKLGSSEKSFLRGIALDHTKHCSFYFPVFYTNTDAYLEWMLETMEPPVSLPFDLRQELIFSN